jgi:hypothetical protein
VADLKVRRTSRLHRRKLLLAIRSLRLLPLRPLRPRALRILVRKELRPDLKSYYKKVAVRDVGEADPAAALRKQLAGGLFQTTVNLNRPGRYPALQVRGVGVERVERVERAAVLVG